MPDYEVLPEQKVPGLIARIKEIIGDKYEDVESSADEILVLKAKKRLTATERSDIEVLLGRKIKER